MATESDELPTIRGRQTQAAIDTAARAVIARKGILAATISDIAAEAGRSTASFYNYYDSKEAMLRQWAERFCAEAADRARAVTHHGLTDRQRIQEATSAHWYSYRSRLAEVIGVSQLAMVNDDFAEYWAQICAISISFITETVKRAQADGYCADDDPHLVAVAIVSMLNQFCYVQLSGKRSDEPDDIDDRACVATMANIFYRAIYYKEAD